MHDWQAPFTTYVIADVDFCKIFPHYPTGEREQKKERPLDFLTLPGQQQQLIHGRFDTDLILSFFHPFQYFRWVSYPLQPTVNGILDTRSFSLLR